MQVTGVRRIVVVSAAPVGTVASARRPSPPRHDPGDGFFMRQVGSRFARAAFGKVYADLAGMEDILADSGLDWTAVRPPRLTSKPLTGTYRTAAGQNVRGGWLVSRADVAHFMLQALDRPETIGQAIGIARLARPRWARQRTRGPASRCAAISSRYQPNESFGVRRWVGKSTWTSPKR